MTSPDSTAESCNCKIGQSIDTYQLGELNADLIRRRQKADASLRDLEAYINQQMLAAAIDQTDSDTTDVYGIVNADEAVPAIYRALTDDDSPPEWTAQVRTRLKQAGIDIAALTQDWVTHPTVRAHLRKCLNIDTSHGNTITTEDATDTIEWARTRCASVIRRTFERLHTAKLVQTGPLDVTISIHVTCTECGSTYSPLQLLDRSNCTCEFDE